MKRGSEAENNRNSLLLDSVGIVQKNPKEEEDSCYTSDVSEFEDYEEVFLKFNIYFKFFSKIFLFNLNI